MSIQNGARTWGATLWGGLLYLIGGVEKTTDISGGLCVANYGTSTISGSLCVAKDNSTSIDGKLRVEAEGYTDIAGRLKVKVITPEKLPEDWDNYGDSEPKDWDSEEKAPEEWDNAPEKDAEEWDTVEKPSESWENADASEKEPENWSYPLEESA